jgi:hypothetical protein
MSTLSNYACGEEVFNLFVVKADVADSDDNKRTSYDICTCFAKKPFDQGEVHEIITGQTSRHA